MKISQVLLDSQDTRKQITGGLTANWKDGKPDSYCALGALACEKGMIKSIGDDVHYYDILRAYGVDPYTMVEYPNYSLFNKKNGGHIDKLITVIWRLNDRYKWSFKKIGKYIKKLENKGVIKYEQN